MTLLVLHIICSCIVSHIASGSSAEGTEPAAQLRKTPASSLGRARKIGGTIGDANVWQLMATTKGVPAVSASH